MPIRVPVLVLFLTCITVSTGFAQSVEFAEEYRALLKEAEANPDDPVRWLLAGYYAGISIQPHEAIRILESIDPLTLPDSSYVQFPSTMYWLYLTSFMNMAGEHEQELEAAKQYGELFPEGFWKYLTVRALAALGRVEDVKRVIRSAEGHPSGMPASVLMSVGAGHLLDHGYVEAAEELAARELAWYEARPLVHEDTDNRSDYAMSLYVSGRWEEAHGLLLQLAEEDSDAYRVRGYQGLVAARTDDAGGAASADRWLADLELPDMLRGINTVYRARIAAAQGDIERAVALLEQALAEGFRKPAELRARVAWEFVPYLDHPAYRDFLRPRE